MNESLLQWLRCPACKGELDLRDAQKNGDDITTGSLACSPCDVSYPIVRSIPRFVPSDDYVKNFSYQWNLFAKTRIEESHKRFERHTGLSEEDLRGKLVLEAGVGTGRYADVVERAGGTVIGIDLSLSVEAARDNLAGRPNAHVVQASIFALPFAEETFDVVYSIGVLHHTPDCREAFLQLPPLVKQGGKLAVMVYAVQRSKVEAATERFWRVFTTRMPHKMLLGLCAVGTAVGYLRSIPPVRSILKYGLPPVLYDAMPKMHYGKGFVVRVQKTFDWYSPKYQSHHTYPEVCGWFEEAGVHELKVLPMRVAVQGRRSAAG